MGVLGCVFRLTARVWNVAVHPVVVENKDFIIFNNAIKLLIINRLWLTNYYNIVISMTYS